jgi:hypothetical protein
MTVCEWKQRNVRNVMIRRSSMTTCGGKNLGGMKMYSNEILERIAIALENIHNYGITVRIENTNYPIVVDAGRSR